MKHKTILVATDFSSASEAALEYATALASQWNAKLLIVHVEEPLVVAGADPFYAQPTSPNPEIRTALERIKPSNDKVRFEHRLLYGFTTDEILRLADHEGADLIVIGTHGRTGLSRVLLGSVAELVVRRAKCPVLALKEPQAVASSAAI